jgi:F-type H+-transporting ATPase subunit a
MEALLHNSMSMGVADLLDNNVGHEGMRYLPMIGSIGLFVLICNLISLVPTWLSPTAVVSVPLGCAIVVFSTTTGPACGSTARFITARISWGRMLSFAADGRRGVGEPSGAIAFAHSSSLGEHDGERNAVHVLSGIDAGDVFLFAGHAKCGLHFGAGSAGGAGHFILLHIFVAFVQAFVFTILPVIYLSGAVGESH